jgi:hypothetical protein
MSSVTGLCDASQNMRETQRLSITFRERSFRDHIHIDDCTRACKQYHGKQAGLSEA